MIALVVLISLIWIACGVVCMTIIYRAGIEEGIRRANSAEGMQYTMHPKMARKLASYRRRQARRATA